ncbi:M23 family metallopeptidase [Tenacibaculum finnmarkense]|uniref:M23 family metallopeptidase n=1 Tax=Tenacibaculum finnmarkense TaxID=2781243 RepID=UPI00187BA52E|nr:peptidoglycan DD-metalloendopeptidase family protein [Tenacibaculum finnmarkense]MBE7649309.1 peptidoglycan DD-metalloendopeptidase family protein [Tenacibaculum finnmarkense genomovar ulcerans]
MHAPLKKIIDRGNDPTGFGHFGAKRGWRNGKRRYHRGHDILSVPGESITSMIYGTVTKVGYMYSSPKSSHLRYVEVTNDLFRIRLCYLESCVKVGDVVCAGQRVGYAENVAKYHNRNKKKGQSLMLNHLHVEMYKDGVLINPKDYLI